MSGETMSGETRADRAWRIVSTQIREGNPANVAAKLALLREDERRLVGGRLPDLFKEMRGERWNIWGADAARANALKVAGAGCLGGAAAVATWLCRSDLRTFSFHASAAPVVDLIAEVVADRPAAWRAEVARRMAARLPLNDNDRGVAWRITERLARDSGEPPPLDDGFVAGWIRWTFPGEIDPGDPFFRALLPGLFEMDAAGRLLDPGGWSVDGWVHSLVRMAAAGQVDRSLLLDGCVRRLLRGGAVQDLRWYGVLHDALEPTVAESTARLRDYLRLLPAAPARVAELALEQVRRVDEAGALEEAAFTEAAEALLFRPEKKLVRAALTWLDRTARPRDRVDAALTALTVAFGQEALDLQERAARIAARHAGRAGDEAREAVRQAAGALHGQARDLLAAAVGPVEPPDPQPSVPIPLAPPAPAPRPLPPPIGSLADLEEAARTGLRGDANMADGERFLAGVVALAYRDPEGARTTLRRVAYGVAPWLEFHYNIRTGHPVTWISSAIRPLVPPRHKVRGHRASGASIDRWPAANRVLLRRALETAEAIGRVPLLLATPTETSGHIDPEVLVERLERLEKENLEPGPVDLDQALLRLPRRIDADVVSRARRLTSPAGRAAASRMAGGLPDPSVTCTVHHAPDRAVYFESAQSSTTDFLLSTVSAPDAEGPVARLLLRHSPQEAVDSVYDVALLSWWPSLLPSHREVVAAHLLTYLVLMTESREGQGEVLLALAEADGPAGAATASALALGLSMLPKERVGAVDALLALCGRRRLPAAAMGEAIGTLAGLGHIKLKRVTDSLAEAAQAGARQDVFAVLTAALPGLLPPPGRRAPVALPDLIALATQTAETIGARADIPGLAEVAARGGSSRLVREAARLHRLLTTS
ncbi:DUF6493 family protein [Actinomadura miaoliensis]|uniref:DUF6493 family protein n=1 Tax=Actinomadura miaoliensis TaxID=430685 RepID=A0ABP7WUK5_9ACTN